jgi:hypothetical protein
MFGDASSDYYKTLQYIGNATYLFDKYGSAKSSGANVPKFIDGVMLNDLFAIVLQTEG